MNESLENLLAVLLVRENYLSEKPKVNVKALRDVSNAINYILKQKKKESKCAEQKTS